MESILEAKKGKSNLTIGSDLYSHDKVIFIFTVNFNN